MREAVRGALEIARSSAVMVQRDELVGELSSPGALGSCLPQPPLPACCPELRRTDAFQGSGSEAVPRLRGAGGEGERSGCGGTGLGLQVEGLLQKLPVFLRPG